MLKLHASRRWIPLKNIAFSVGRSMSSSKINEGVFAINKPPSVTSAQALRDLQHAFNPSGLFRPWIEQEKARRAEESRFQRKRRRDKRVQVKLGHGGTLDPLATGVLIVGVGKGTKQLQQFLECTKCYETTVLFGVETDTYDVTGKILKTAPFSHITQAKVEEAMRNFEGSISQRPPIYSALRIQGKRLYEYAREGEKLPVEIQERPVTVEKLELLEWMEPGTHSFEWPAQEASEEEQLVAAKLDALESSENPPPSLPATNDTDSSRKRHRDETETQPSGGQPSSKRQAVEEEGIGERSTTPAKSTASTLAGDTESASSASAGHISKLKGSPLAVKFRMTVTSGFYVRSFCHDLGKALGSAGAMATLVRTRQGEFELGENVLSFEQINEGEDKWGPEVSGMLESWQKKSQVSTD